MISNTFSQSLNSIDSLLIIDFGSQYTQLIAKRLRDQQIYCTIIEPEDTVDFNQCKGIILSGGPDSVYAPNSPTLNWIHKSPVPILGICYGMQLLAQNLGGKVQHGISEFGNTKVTIKSSLLFSKIPTQFSVFMSHTDYVSTLPPLAKCIAFSNENTIAGFEKEQFYAIQWHPEVTHSQFGNQLLYNFAINVCHIKPIWNTDQMISLLTQYIQDTVQDNAVIMACSGGVDSMVATVLIHQIIGKQFHGIFVDNGLLIDAKKTWTSIQKLHLPIKKIQAKKLFLSHLKYITDPEKKRKIIGKTFIQVFQNEFKKFSYLAQGTIYPDVIESHGKHSHTIKSHHNVGGLPKNFSMKLVEPFRYLFKDEVQKLGENLNISKSILHQQPFPGPGLAVRIMGAITPHAINIVKQADKIFQTILEEYKLNPKQAFAIYLPQKTTGIVGDKRRYGITIALRAITTDNFMTAKILPIPFDVLSKISRTITERIPECSRVVYDITDKPPGTIEWE